ncbi:MAG: hypothetical protein QOH09_1426 [Pseudonocardiales bacterium]|jgi:hypothetical protein|nr:hypothetical protein [Pseudonocardiales bacterium]
MGFNAACRDRWTFADKTAFIGGGVPARLPAPLDAAASPCWPRTTRLCTAFEQHRHAEAGLTQGSGVGRVAHVPQPHRPVSARRRPEDCQMLATAARNVGSRSGRSSGRPKSSHGR